MSEVDHECGGVCHEGGVAMRRCGHEGGVS